MKKLSSAIILVLLMALFPAGVFAAAVPQEIVVQIDGKQISYNVKPVLVNDRTFVQFRPTFEDLGMKVEWDQAAHKVTGTKDGYKIEFVVGKTEAVVNGTAVQLDAAPFIKDDYAMIPLRFISEATGRFVHWNHDQALVSIVKTDLSEFTDMFYSGKLTYQGDMVDGVWEGEGRLNYPNGFAFYTGSFKQGKLEGHGKYQDDKGYVVYEGDWKNNLMDGSGKWYYGDGDLKYDGSYKAGKRSGQGKFIWRWVDGESEVNYPAQDQKDTNGDNVYVGSFANDKFSGQGTLTWADGSSYKGNFMDGMLHGQGVYVWSDGWTYKGSFAYGDRNGYGELYNADGGLVYKGSFKDNRYNGQGELFDGNGKSLFKGEFVNGERKN